MLPLSHCTPEAQRTRTGEETGPDGPSLSGAERWYLGWRVTLSQAWRSGWQSLNPELVPARPHTFLCLIQSSPSFPEAFTIGPTRHMPGNGYKSSQTQPIFPWLNRNVIHGHTIIIDTQTCKYLTWDTSTCNIPDMDALWKDILIVREM